MKQHQPLCRIIKDFPMISGDVLQLDSFPIHHSTCARASPDFVGVEPLFIPPYAPWVNRIGERVFYCGAQWSLHSENPCAIQQSATPRHLPSFSCKSFLLREGSYVGA